MLYWIEFEFTFEKYKQLRILQTFDQREGDKIIAGELG